jgi:hypothetical protein
VVEVVVMAVLHQIELLVKVVLVVVLLISLEEVAMQLVKTSDLKQQIKHMISDLCT